MSHLRGGVGLCVPSGTLGLHFIIRNEHHAEETEEICVRVWLLAFISIVANLFSQIIQALI